MEADGSRGSRHRYYSTRQQQQQLLLLHHQQQPEAASAYASPPLDSIMSESEVLGSSQFLPYPANMEDSPQPTRMNGNAIPWSSMISNPLSHNISGVFPTHLLSPEQFPYSRPYHNSTMGHTLIIPPTVASREREVLAVAANQRAAREARIAASLIARQEPPVEPPTSPCKSTRTATRKPVEGECPVCWESFLDTQAILFCKTTCGQNFHKSCIVEWLTAPANRQELLKCPMCRGAWDDQELKELHQENGICPPRPAKRLRADTAWAARQQRQEHMRRITRQRVYERRNSAERLRATSVLYDRRPNFFVPDDESPRMSPTSLTSPHGQFSPPISHQLPSNPSSRSLPRATQGMVQPTMSSGGTSFVEVSTTAQPSAVDVSRFMPTASNSSNNGLRPAQMMPFQFQPPQAIAAFQPQPGSPYPMYPVMSPQTYQPASLSMFQSSTMSRNRPQGTRTPTTPTMQNSTLPAQQHPCPAMRQQNMIMQQQVYPGSLVPQPYSTDSQAPWEFHQYHYSQTYTTVYMNH